MSSVYRLLIQVLGKDQGASRTLRGVKQEAMGLESAMGSLTSVMGAVAGIAGMGYMAKQAGEMVWELGKLGAQSMQLEASFDELAKQAGGSADAILAAIKRASDGTVSDMDAIAAANKGMLLGLGASAEQWERLTEVARFRGRAMGLTVTQALSDITTGLGRMEPEILDNLGIIVDGARLYDDLGESLGKTANQLTKAEKKQALMNEVLRVGGEQIEAAGGIARNAADDFLALETSVANLKKEAGEAFAPFAAEGAANLGRIVTAIMMVAEGSVSASDAIRIFGEATGDTNEELGKSTDALLAQAAALPGSVKLWDEMTAAYKDWQLQVEIHAEVGDKATEATMNLAEGLFKAARGAYFASRKFNDVGEHLKPMDEQADRAESGVSGLAGAMWDAAFSAVLYKDSLIGAFGGVDVFIEGARALHQEMLTLRSDFITTAATAKTTLTDAAEDSSTAWKDAAREMRSAIASALTPTSVTALDMEQTALGEYVDKWDEDARRFDAIAQGGFGALQDNPLWANLLKIPPEILAGSEAGLKAYAEQAADDVRNLFRPDLIDEGDLDKMVEKVETYLRNQEARETTISMVASKMGMNEQDVAKALGDPAAIGQSTVGGIMEGVQAGLVEYSPAGEFLMFWGKDTDAKAAQLQSAGAATWLYIETGIHNAINEGAYLDWLVDAIAPEIKRWLLKTKPWEND